MNNPSPSHGGLPALRITAVGSTAVGSTAVGSTAVGSTSVRRLLPRNPGRAGGLRLLAIIPVLTAALAACGGGDSYYDDVCSDSPSNVPAIEVHMVSAADGRPIFAPVTAELSAPGYLTLMESPEPRYAQDGYTSLLQGGWGRPGVYDVVATNNITNEQLAYWPGVNVSGDECGPFTQVLTLELQP